MTTSPQLPAVIPPALPMVAQAETVTLLPALDPAQLAARRQDLLTVCRNVLKEGEHFGQTPGTNKPSLFKPGAEILNQYFGLYAEFDIMQQVENWDKAPPLFDYTFKCTIRSKRDAVKIAEGVGSCNSYEGKYRYRDAKRSCPDCGRAGSIIKGKAEYGGGWICWSKDPAACCKAKFLESDKRIIDQPIGKIDNEDLPSLKNTILKMAAKRAYIDATLKATGASEIYTQDTEDIYTVEVLSVEAVQEAAKEQKEAVKAAGQPDPKPQASASSSNATTVATTTEKASPASSSNPAQNASSQNANATVAPSADQSANTAKSTAKPADTSVTKEQMGQLLAAAEANGWERPQVSEFVLFAFNIKKEEMATKFTSKQWELAIKLVSHPGNAKGKVSVKADGQPLDAKHCWPQAQGGK